MAFLQVNFFAETIGLHSSMNVILPVSHEKSSERDIPTLWLLHGLSDDHTIWHRRTRIEAYADKKGIAVVMPAVGRSFYTNMKLPQRAQYYNFISDELPKIARSMFPLSDKREKNYIAGLSMGGYGAMKMGLLNPDKYCLVGALSGVLDICEREESMNSASDSLYQELLCVFGNPEELRGSDNDLVEVAKRAGKQPQNLPKLYIACGTEDFLYENNLGYLKVLDECNINYIWEQGPGEHTWNFWDKYIQRVIDLI